MKFGIGTIFFLGVCTSIWHPVTAVDKLVYKFVNTYELIWNDAGSGADSDVSIWKPTDISGYYPVGDVSLASHARPDFYAMVVKDETGKTAKPIGFSQIWKDSGSGAHWDVAIYRMSCPHSYESLGDVAVRSHSTQPDREKYRCVGSQLLTNGQYRLIWNDRGSGAHSDVSLWRRDESNSFVNGLAASTFFSHATHATPNGNPRLLDHTKAMEASMLPPNENVALTLRPAEMELVWKDSGSGARRDFASYRPKNCIRLADSAVGNYHDVPLGYCVEEMKPGALSRVNSLWKIWDDAGSGASWDGSFWRMACPPGYVSLGHVSKRDHYVPDATNYRCVKSEYVTQGSFSWVWNDGGSGANRDVSVFRADGRSGSLGINAMYAVDRHGNPYEAALVLKADVVDVKSGKPLSEMDVIRIDYKIDTKKLVATKPFAAQPTEVSNCGEGSVTQSIKRVLAYTETVTSSWNWGISVAIGVTVKWESGLPLIGGAEKTLSVEVTNSYGETFSTSDAVSDSIWVTISVPANRKTSAWAVGKKQTMDVPFTAQVQYKHTDGTTSTGQITGIYRGMEITAVDVQFGDMIAC